MSKLNPRLLPRFSKKLLRTSTTFFIDRRGIYAPRYISATSEIPFGSYVRITEEPEGPLPKDEYSDSRIVEVIITEGEKRGTRGRVFLTDISPLSPT